MRWLYRRILQLVVHEAVRWIGRIEEVEVVEEIGAAVCVLETIREFAIVWV